MAHNKTESLPTTAKAWVTYTVTDGIAYEDRVRIGFTQRDADRLYRQAVRAVVADEMDSGWDDFPAYSVSFTDEVCEHWYKKLAEGERQTDVYQAEVEIPLVDLPYYQLATSLAVALDGALRALAELHGGAGKLLAQRQHAGLFENAQRVMDQARQELASMRAPESYT